MRLVNLIFTRDDSVRATEPGMINYLQNPHIIFGYSNSHALRPWQQYISTGFPLLRICCIGLVFEAPRQAESLSDASALLRTLMLQLLWLCWNPTSDLRQLMKTPSWNVGIFWVMKQPQYQLCLSYQHRWFLQLDISELFWSYTLIVISFDMAIQPSPPVDGKINMLVIISGQGRHTRQSSAWQQHFCRWRRSIATGNDVEQSNSALWKFPQGPPGPFVSFRFHSIWETPCLVHLKVQGE